MSDTANPGKLASSPLASRKEFDARLKRTDEDRWLATRYAPDAVRPLLVAIYLVDQELRRALAAKEPMLGKIRVQWWRETIGQIGGEGPVRRHDLAEELAQFIGGRHDLIAPINDLIDRYDDILDDHLRSGGHQPGGEHEQRHLKAEASLVRLAGLALDASAGQAALNALSLCGEAHIAVLAQLPDAGERWQASRKAARTLPSKYWPAIVHLAAVGGGPAGNQRNGRKPLEKRWRILAAMLRRRL